MFGFKKKNRIRKDAGELTLDDLQFAPVWGFCLDEEGVEGQTECTVRPVWPRGSLDAETCDAIVAAEFAAPSGRILTGILMPHREGFRWAWHADPTLFLDRPAGEIIDHPLLHTYNKVMAGYSPRISLALPFPAHESAENVRTLMDLAYRALGRTPEELFPLTCRPRVAIKGWPQTFKIAGFLRPVDGNAVAFEAMR